MINGTRVLGPVLAALLAAAGLSIAQLLLERKALLEQHDSLPHCHYAGECSRVCPRGVDPAKAIQLMKRELVMDLFRARKRKPAQPIEADLSPPAELDEGLTPPAYTLLDD